MMIIYKATNKINGKSYIGKTVKKLYIRVCEHLSASNRDSQHYFHKAIRKYGIQSFDWLIIDTSETNEILTEKEIYWIKFLNTKAPNGYNLTDGGEGMTGWIPTEDNIKNMSNAQKGKTPWNKGKSDPYTDETIRKMSESHKDIPLTEEQKRKISVSLIGKNKGKKFGPHTEERKKKISEANKGQISWSKGKKIGPYKKKQKNVEVLNG